MNEDEQATVMPSTDNQDNSSEDRYTLLVKQGKDLFEIKPVDLGKPVVIHHLNHKEPFVLTILKYRRWTR